MKKTKKKSKPSADTERLISALRVIRTWASCDHVCFLSAIVDFADEVLSEVAAKRGEG